MIMKIYYLDALNHIQNYKLYFFYFFKVFRIQSVSNKVVNFLCKITQKLNLFFHCSIF